MEVSRDDIKNANIIWDYHHVHHEVKPCDCILGLGSNDIRVASRVAELYLSGFAPLVFFSGGLGNFTEGVWNEPEARIFSKIAMDMGVPSEKILVEDQSTNSGENLEFTRQLLESNDINPKSFLLVQKPFMERRAYATFKKLMPNKDVIVTSPKISFLDYPNEYISMNELINTMVGDLHRIMKYPSMGFQIAQEIPLEVKKAFNSLVSKGFIKHLLAPS
ncbi:YdcF family protein [Candidatus Bathyarchaeota archaeon]|nr:YdcF family protein [Candidatus Bathyarchaeota archaeon]